MTVEFNQDQVLVACSVAPLVTVDGASEQLAAQRAVRDNDAVSYVGQIKRLVKSVQELRDELRNLEEENSKLEKRKRFVLAFKPSTRILSCLFRQGNFQATLLLPVDYPASPVQLLELEDMVTFKNFDSLVERIREELGSLPRIKDWIWIMQRELGTKSG